MSINTVATEQLIRRLAYRDPSLTELEAYASAHHVPIIQPESASLIRTQILLRKPRRLLEIGTAIGYSAIGFAKTFSPLSVLTLERDEEMAMLATENVKKFRLEDRIEIRRGEAEETMKAMIEGGEEPFDLIFIDAAKSKYAVFFELADQLLKDDGLIVCDNVLFKGMVADDSLAEKNKKSIVRNLRRFLEELCQSERYATSVIPIGDGISLSVRRNHGG